MRSPEYVLLFGTVGRAPEVQNDIPKLLLPRGFIVEDCTPDYTGNNYETWLEAQGEHIRQLAKRWRVSILAYSGGVPPGLSLYLRHLDILYRAVLHSGKIMSSYEFDNPLTAAKNQNLADSGETLQRDHIEFGDRFLDGVLCTHGEKDRRISPDQSVLADTNGNPLTHTYTFPTSEHIETLGHAMTTALSISPNFLRDGMLPTPV